VTTLRFGVRRTWLQPQHSLKCGFAGKQSESRSCPLDLGAVTHLSEPQALLWDGDNDPSSFCVSLGGYLITEVLHRSLCTSHLGVFKQGTSDPVN
jgi:hypothetical protein